MRFKFILFFLALIFTGILHAQNKVLHVDYDFYFKNFYPEIREIKVSANQKESLCIITRTINYKEYGALSFEPKSWYTNFYRSNDSIIYEEKIDNELYVVGELLNQFEWKLTGNSKTILGYTCSEAKTLYRGREYTAYFTTKLPFRAAPWKFHGLPGVLLLVRTNDNQIWIEAKGIQIKTTTDKIKRPFNHSNTIVSWEQFKEKYVESWNIFKNKTISQLSLSGRRENSVGMSKIKPGLRMELLVEGN